MSEIEYVTGGRSLLDEVAPLWEKLNEHHGRVSAYFAKFHAGFTWENRRSAFERKAQGGEVLVILARDTVSGSKVGYCMSVVTSDGAGTVDSLFVEGDYRGRHIGSTLTERSLAWLRETGAKSVVIGVSVGNERAYNLYGRFGFYPRTVILAEPPE